MKEGERMEEKERERERERGEENIITCNDYHDNRLQNLIVVSYRYMHEVLTSDQGHITQHTKHLVGTLG